MLDKQVLIDLLETPEVADEISKNFSIILYNAKSGVSGIQNYSDYRTPQRAMEENSQFRAKLKIINGDIKQLEYEERRMNNQSAYATGVHWVPLERKTEANITQTQNDNIRDDSRLQDMIRNTEEHGNFSSGFIEFKDKVENLIKAYLAKYHPDKSNSQANWFKNLDVSDSEPTPNTKSDIPTNERFRNLDIDNVNQTERTYKAPPSIDEFLTDKDKMEATKRKEFESNLKSNPQVFNDKSKKEEEMIKNQIDAFKSGKSKRYEDYELNKALKKAREESSGKQRSGYFLDEDDLRESKKSKSKNEILSERMIFILKNLLQK